MKQKVLIEFVGLPGSGKSTVSRALCNVEPRIINLVPSKFRYRYVFISTTLRHLKSISVFAKHPKQCNQLIKPIFASEQLSLNNARATAINLLYKIDLYKKMSAKHINLMEEGLLHAILSAMITANNKVLIREEAMRYIDRKVDFKWIVVYLDNDLETTLDRLNQRNIIRKKDHRIFKYTLQETVEEIKVNFEKILNPLIENKTAELIKIKNDDLQLTIQKIQQVLKQKNVL